MHLCILADFAAGVEIKIYFNGQFVMAICKVIDYIFVNVFSDVIKKKIFEYYYGEIVFNHFLWAHGLGRVGFMVRVVN